MKTLFLHIGRGKTGTTAIQQTLAEHRGELLHHGLHYVASAGGADGGGHSAFGKSFIDQPPPEMDPEAQPELVRSKVAEELRHCSSRAALISSEDLELATVARVRDFISSLGMPLRTRIILFVRSQDELAESQYNQMVKLKGEKRPFFDYIESIAQSLHYTDMVHDWAEQFGQENVVARVYDAARLNVVEELLQCVGLPHTAIRIARPESSNASIGAKSLWVARILNEASFPDRQSIIEALQEDLAGHEFPALLFDSEQARSFRSRFNHSNLEFSQRFLGRPMSDLGGRRYDDDYRDKIRAAISTWMR